MQSLNWEEVTNYNELDECYNTFCSFFNTLYDLHFAWATVKFNCNIHKIAEFMTQGLLMSRLTKVRLLKLSHTDPTPTNKDKYKQYRKIYNTLIRASKKSHIKSKIKHNAKNPKKLSDTLKDLTTGKNNKLPLSL